MIGVHRTGYHNGSAVGLYSEVPSSNHSRDKAVVTSRGFTQSVYVIALPLNLFRLAIRHSPQP
jgi:hypothetical protein